jgi:hypothetical protein
MATLKQAIKINYNMLPLEQAIKIDYDMLTLNQLAVQLFHTDLYRMGATQLMQTSTDRSA